MPSDSSSEQEPIEALRRRNADLEQRVVEQEQTIAALRRAREPHLVEEQAAAESQLLIAAVECSSDFIATATLDGTPLYVNEAGRRMVGLESLEEVQRTRIPEYFLPEDIPLLEQILRAVYADGRWEGEFRFRHFKTGAAIPVHYNLFLIRDRGAGQPLGLATVTRDLRAMKQVEQERKLQEETIRAQAAALAVLSTPLIPISNRVLVMPLIGTVDSTRARRVIEALLHGVSARRASVAILDITGVSVVDTAVAEALVGAAQAVRLLGAEVVLTGIRPEVAQELIEMGADLREIVTRSTLQSGIAFAMRRRSR